MALGGGPIGISLEGGHGQAPAAHGEAGSGQEAREVVAVAHQQHPPEGRRGGRRVGQPGGKGSELAGGILAAAIEEEGPGACAEALGGGGLAGEGAAEEEQGPGTALEGGIEAVVAVKHHHQGGAAGGGQGRAEKGPEAPEGGSGDGEGAGDSAAEVSERGRCLEGGKTQPA